MPLIVADEADGGNGDTDTILKHMAVIMKKLEARERLPEKYSTVRKRLHRKPSHTEQSFSPGVVNRERRYIIMATVGIPLKNTSLTFPDLCHVIADVLTSLRSYGPESDIESPDRVLHWDISVSNIIVAVCKGDVILLDNECFVRALQVSVGWVRHKYRCSTNRLRPFINGPGSNKPEDSYRAYGIHCA